MKNIRRLLSRDHEISLVEKIPQTSTQKPSASSVLLNQRNERKKWFFFSIHRFSFYIHQPLIYKKQCTLLPTQLTEEARVYLALQKSREGELFSIIVKISRPYIFTAIDIQQNGLHFSGMTKEMREF